MWSFFKWTRKLQAEIVAAYNDDLKKAVQVEEKLAREDAHECRSRDCHQTYQEKYAEHQNLTVSCVMSR